MRSWVVRAIAGSPLLAVCATFEIVKPTSNWMYGFGEMMPPNVNSGVTSLTADAPPDFGGHLRRELAGQADEHP